MKRLLAALAATLLVLAPLHACTAPCTQNTMTALGQWAGGFVSGTVANVTSWQKSNAAATAAAAVTPVNPQ